MTALHDPAAFAGVQSTGCVLVGPRRMDVCTAPLRDPDPGEVRVRLTGSGVCASSLPVWEGREWFTYPLAPGAPGHEGWGTVDAIGAGVEGLAPGDRVTALSHHAFAEYDFAPAACVVPLPRALADRPFPGEALGCAMNVMRRADIRPGHDVAIVGVGFLGALLTQLAAAAGARVIAISRRAYALDIAQQFGAEHVVAMDDHHAIVRDVLARTSGAGCDRVIEATGEQWPLDLAAELTRERGKLVIAGYHQDGARQVNMQLWNWRGLDVINAHERDPAEYVIGMQLAVDAVARGVLNPFGLFTHSVPLTDVGRAFQLTRERPAGFMKALVLT